ncbi:uncharacterized protein Ecym_6046 [Eremothecium cymbalariae DBVPG|uniref:Uncharacterized protein n=1 Tax=Eremothecium cymbalariae (strain CBS 270.75 / DBVPG 7215 / KCTC 17166 / NRRL Y-17582) TaxID=931890 RepID=G8JUX0_ERECY|nr:hypothetical protein Ecym_6046 [Eremothecium cymbalariae DBVPG\
MRPLLSPPSSLADTQEVPSRPRNATCFLSKLEASPFSVTGTAENRVAVLLSRCASSLFSRKYTCIIFYAMLNLLCSSRCSFLWAALAGYPVRLIFRHRLSDPESSVSTAASAVTRPILSVTRPMTQKRSCRHKRYWFLVPGACVRAV